MFLRKEPWGAALPAGRVTCPCREDSGKADHIGNYRSRRWRDLSLSDFIFLPGQEKGSRDEEVTSQVGQRPRGIQLRLCSVKQCRLL